VPRAGVFPCDACNVRWLGSSRWPPLWELPPSAHVAITHASPFCNLCIIFAYILFPCREQLGVHGQAVAAMAAERDACRASADDSADRAKVCHAD